MEMFAGSKRTVCMDMQKMRDIDTDICPHIGVLHCVTYFFDTKHITIVGFCGMVSNERVTLADQPPVP